MKHTPSDIDDIVRRVMSRLVNQQSAQPRDARVEETGRACACDGAVAGSTVEAIVSAVIDRVVRESQQGKTRGSDRHASAIPCGCDRSAAPDAGRSSSRSRGASQGGCSCGCRADTPALAGATPSASHRDDFATVVLTQHVVSAADVESLGDHVRQVVVAARSVITPSALDALHDRGIELQRQNRANAVSRSAGQSSGREELVDAEAVGRSLRVNVTLVCDYDIERQRTDVVDVRAAIEPSAAAFGGVRGVSRPTMTSGGRSVTADQSRSLANSVLIRPNPEVLRSAATRYAPRPR